MGVHGQLLHGAVDRGGELRQAAALVGLVLLLRELVALELGLGLALAQRAQGFGLEGGAGVAAFFGSGFGVAGLVGSGNFVPSAGFAVVFGTGSFLPV